MEMNAIAAGLLPVGLAIALGALARRFLIPDEADWAGLNKITFYLLVPGLVISTLANADIAAIPVREIAQALVLAAALVALVLGAVYAATPKTAEAKAGYSSLFQTATRWNAAVALGVTGEMYGAVALTVIALSMLVLMPAVNVVNIALLTRLHSERRLRLGESLWKVLSNPIIVGCLLGLAVSLPGVSVWPPLMNVVDALADASIAAILLIVGAGLRLSNWSAPRARRNIALSCALKLVLMPLCTLLLAAALGLRGVLLSSVVIVAAVPTAMHGYVLAREMGGDAPLYASAASLQVLLSFVTLPCWIWLAASV